MKQKQVIFTVFLALFSTSLSLRVEAQNTFEVDGINYSIIQEADESSSVGTAQVCPLTYGQYEDDIVIPNAVKQSDDPFADTYKIIGIAPEAFANCEDLESVKLPVSLEFIGERAFYNSGLKEIIIPFGNLKEIAEDAFAGCSLKSISLPGSITTIGQHAFADSDLESFEADGVVTIENGAFSNCTSLTSVKLSDALAAIGDGAFYRCLDLASITIPSSTKSIGDNAFGECKSLTEISLPEGLREIKNNAFNQSGLTSVVIPQSITRIEDGVFSRCDNLRKVELPKTLKRIGEFAFSGCRSLHEIVLPENVTKINNMAFIQCSELAGLYLKGTTPPEIENDILGFASKSNGYAANDEVSIFVPASSLSAYKSANGWDKLADRIQPYDYAKNDPLKQEYKVTAIKSQEYANYSGDSFTVPEGIETIGSAAFYGSKNLQTVILPASLVKISASAFAECPQLKTIVLPASLQQIEQGAFMSCVSLEQIVIPQGVTKIDDYVFSGCKGLKVIQLPTSLKEIGNHAFSNCSSLEEVTLPKGLEVIDEFAFDGCSVLQSIVIPEGVTAIRDRAFAFCRSLKSLTLPKSLKTVNKEAFWGARMDSLKILGDYSSWDKGALSEQGIKEIIVRSLPSDNEQGIFGENIGIVTTGTN